MPNCLLSGLSLDLQPLRVISIVWYPNYLVEVSFGEEFLPAPELSSSRTWPADTRDRPRCGGDPRHSSSFSSISTSASVASFSVLALRASS